MLRLVEVALVLVLKVEESDWMVEDAVARSDVKVPAPAVSALLAMLIEPKPEVMEPVESAPTDVRPRSVVKLGSVVVAERRLSKRVAVKYWLVPSGRSLVVAPPETNPAAAFKIPESAPMAS